MDSAISIMVSVLSLVVAIIQTVRLSKLRKLRVNRLRQDLVNCRQAVLESDRLHKKRASYGISEPVAIAKIRVIHDNACNLTRSLFEQLSEVDKPYNGARLEQYAQVGLITSKWFWRQAALFVNDPRTLIMPPNLPDDTPDYMEEIASQSEPHSTLAAPNQAASADQKASLPGR